MIVTVNMKKTAMWLLAAASVWASAGRPVQAQVQEGTVQNEADAAPVLVQKKQGLVREGRNYCYYVKGQKVRRVWKKIHGRKYYFGNNGNAATDLYRSRVPTIFSTKRASFWRQGGMPL